MQFSVRSVSSVVQRLFAFAVVAAGTDRAPWGRPEARIRPLSSRRSGPVRLLAVRAAARTPTAPYRTQCFEFFHGVGSNSDSSSGTSVFASL
jgi:hypothetical protein